MRRPHDTVHRSIDVDEETLVAQSVDGALKHQLEPRRGCEAHLQLLSDLKLIDLHEDLLQHLLFETEQQHAVQGGMSNDTSSMQSAHSERSSRS